MGGALTVEDGTANLNNKTAVQILEDTYAHEASHAFDNIHHTHGGIMSIVNVYNAVDPGFANVNLAMIRSSNGP
jgi:hypothetical protein